MERALAYILGVDSLEAASHVDSLQSDDRDRVQRALSGILASRVDALKAHMSLQGITMGCYARATQLAEVSCYHLSVVIVYSIAVPQDKYPSHLLGL